METAEEPGILPDSAALARRLLDPQTQALDAHALEGALHPLHELAPEVGREVLGARVVDRQDEHVLARREVGPLAVAHLDKALRVELAAELLVLAGHDPVLVELADELADQRLDVLEVDHQAEARELGLDLDVDAVVVPVQALGRPVGKDQEVGGRELQVLLLDLDRPALHGPEPSRNGARPARSAARPGPGRAAARAPGARWALAGSSGHADSSPAGSTPIPGGLCGRRAPAPPPQTSGCNERRDAASP
jgi:hypothetical protein